MYLKKSRILRSILKILKGTLFWTPCTQEGIEGKWKSIDGRFQVIVQMKDYNIWADVANIIGYIGCLIALQDQDWDCKCYKKYMETNLFLFIVLEKRNPGVSKDKF